jgi:hypothetical protein
MNKEAIKRKKDMLDAEIRLARPRIEEAKTAAAQAEQHFENALNHVRRVDKAMSDKVKIFKYRDQADLTRCPVYVCVCLSYDDTTTHVHLYQSVSDTTPQSLDEYLAKADNASLRSVVLSVSEFPKLTKQIQAAVKELKAKP